MNEQPRVTIVVSPRERFSLSERTLSSIYEHTKLPFHLIYAAGGTPAVLQERLLQEADSKGFELLLRPQYLSPNQARNLAIPRADTEYIVFLDSDALVAPRWLDYLLQCADETGAQVVGPLYLIHEFELATIHMAGGWLSPENRDGKRYLLDEQHLYDTPLAKVDTRLKRRRCDYVEFHCMLVRKSVFDDIDLLDEALLNLHEERDFCMSVVQAGGEVYLEPRAVVTYVPPPPCEWWDLPYFMLRWSEDWSLASVRAFNKKWHIDGVRHVSDQSEAYEEGTVIGFASAWRSRIAGTTFHNGVNDPIDCLNQSLLMVVLLSSVGMQYASLSVNDRQHQTVQQMSAAPVSDVIQSIASLSDPEYGYYLNLMPTSSDVAVPLLMRLGQLSKPQYEFLAPFAVLALETASEQYECWFAARENNLRRVLTEMAHFDQLTSVSRWYEPVALAGSLLPASQTDAGGPCRLKLLKGQVGRLLSEYELVQMNLHDFAAHAMSSQPVESNDA